MRTFPSLSLSLSLQVNAKGKIAHHAIAAGTTPGEFVVNGKATVSANSLAALIDMWVGSPL